MLIDQVETNPRPEVNNWIEYEQNKNKISGKAGKNLLFSVPRTKNIKINIV